MAANVSICNSFSDFLLTLLPSAAKWPGWKKWRNTGGGQEMAVMVDQ